MTEPTKATVNLESALARSPLGPGFAQSDNPLTRWLASELALIWAEFEGMLSRTPIVQAIESRSIDLATYRLLLRDLRQQVIDGARWLATAAANMSIPLFDLRSALLRHAAVEHTDFKMLERDYCSVGGHESDILLGQKNIGSEALSCYLFHVVRQSDPLGMFGAVFIFEGLGCHRAGRWAQDIKASLGLTDDNVSFLKYHGEEDDSHFDRLRSILSSPAVTESKAKEILTVARVTARLYALQLESLGKHCLVSLT